MKYGIISDIHSNLEALETALPYLKDVDRILCLGDIVGYGPNPNECVEKVREIADLILAGNHDLASVGLEDISNFSDQAKESTLWEREILITKNKEFLKGLPTKISNSDFIAVHGSLFDLVDEYIEGHSEAAKTFARLEGKLCFVGHTHRPCCFTLSERGEIEGYTLKDKDIIRLRKGKKYIVNLGSVGQPRDGDRRASFGYYDPEKGEILNLRLAYDIKKTQRLMQKKGLHPLSILRLSLGM